jgi:hypothetical protein
MWDNTSLYIEKCINEKLEVGLQSKYNTWDKKLEKPEELIGKETATKNQDIKFYPGVINETDKTK